MAVATWRAPRDGRLYGRLAVDATALLAYVAEQRAASGEHVTVTHVVGKAVARAMREVPEAHGRVLLGRVVPYPSCDIGFAVDLGGSDVAPVKVVGADTASVAEIARQLARGAARLRDGADRDFETSSRLARIVPWWLARPLLTLAGFVNGGLGLRAFGQPGFPLGSAFVSNVGRFGLDEGLLAPVPFARAPLYVLVGRLADAPLAVDGAVVVRPQLIVTFTADHRVIDGVQAGGLVGAVRAGLLDPTLLG
ncbi:MAG TPA: 2-oxo acid dehydrogenase subunit E2 [Mycobacteriales bacterium]|nr:2-oxo acid dehydrogenase subunit E2 [Mycobacteriales bacterium]